MFKSARLKLTLWYLFIITLISVSFSVVIYHVLDNEIERFARSPRFRVDRQFADEAKSRIIFQLVLVNGTILLVAGGAAYFLAGRTLRPIKKMVDEQSRFISDASHEFRTPLTSLKSAFEVYLRDKKADLKQAKNLVWESIVEVDKMENLSNSLLQLAKFENPNIRKNFEMVLLKETIDDAIKKTQSSAKVQGRDYKILADRETFTNLWVILLDNANKYSPKKSKIDIRLEKLDGVTKVVIEDQGMGISQDDLPNIFDRFYRANKARSKNGVGGYGLGLAIAKKIVEEHNGKIFASSVEGKGTIMTVLL